MPISRQAPIETPKFLRHKVSEQWLTPTVKRITNYPYWKTGSSVQNDYLLRGHGARDIIVVRNQQGQILNLTREEAIYGALGGVWAQVTEITPFETDFSKIEHFWPRAVVLTLSSRFIKVSDRLNQVVPRQVTVHDMYRVVGYLDIRSGQLLKQETYSRDRKGWSLVDEQEIEYDAPFGRAFDESDLHPTSQFTFGVAARAARS